MHGNIRGFLLVRGAGAVMSGGRQVAPGRPGCGVRGGAARVGVPRVRYFLPFFAPLERSVVSEIRASQSAARAGLTAGDKENTLAAGRMSEANRGAWRVFRR